MGTSISKNKNDKYTNYYQFRPVDFGAMKSYYENHINNGNIEAYIDLIRTYRHFEPGNKDKIHSLCREAVSRGQYKVLDQLTEYIDIGVTDNNLNDVVFNYYYRVLVNDKQYEKIIDLHDKLMANNPSAEGRYSDIGNMHRELGSINKAIECYQKGNGHINLGFLCYSLGNYELAEKYAMRVNVPSVPSGSDFAFTHKYWLLSVLYSRKYSTRHQAIDCLEKLIKYPYYNWYTEYKNVMPHYILFIIYTYYMRDTDTALKYYESIFRYSYAVDLTGMSADAASIKSYLDSMKKRSDDALNVKYNETDGTITEVGTPEPSMSDPEYISQLEQIVIEKIDNHFIPKMYIF